MKYLWNLGTPSAPFIAPSIHHWIESVSWKRLELTKLDPFFDQL